MRRFAPFCRAARSPIAAMLAALVVTAAPAGVAETRDYGAIYLNGLARDSWPLNPPGVSYAMVCNVNGPDGFLSVRAGPGTDAPIRRKLNRLAILEVDTRHRSGHWIRVNTAFRSHSKTGRPIAHKSLHVEGWAHDGYLCDFLD